MSLDLKSDISMSVIPLPTSTAGLGIARTLLPSHAEMLSDEIPTETGSCNAFLRRCDGNGTLGERIGLVGPHNDTTQAESSRGSSQRCDAERGSNVLPRDSFGIDNLISDAVAGTPPMTAEAVLARENGSGGASVAGPAGEVLPNTEVVRAVGMAGEDGLANENSAGTVGSGAL